MSVNVSQLFSHETGFRVSRPSELTHPKIENWEIGQESRRDVFLVSLRRPGTPLEVQKTSTHGVEPKSDASNSGHFAFTDTVTSARGSGRSAFARSDCPSLLPG